jgi:hypothetical protein
VALPSGFDFGFLFRNYFFFGHPDLPIDYADARLGSVTVGGCECQPDAITLASRLKLKRIAFFPCVFGQMFEDQLLAFTALSG